MQNDFVLLLQEVLYHPESYVKNLCKGFEVTSIIKVSARDELKQYRKLPLFDEKYLVLFDNLKAFEGNRAYLNFDIMFPVILLERPRQTEEAIFTCREYNLNYKVFVNQFTKEQAYQFIQSSVSVPVSDSFCKALIGKVGLNPLRIISALSLCENGGFTPKNVNRVIDKWRYVDNLLLIEALLGVPISKKVRSNICLYLYSNRFYERYILRNLIDELEKMIGIFGDKLNGLISEESLIKYSDGNKLSKQYVLYCVRLFNKVSLVSLVRLQEWLKLASLLEIILLL